MSYNAATLSNGLRIIHLPSFSSVSYCGFAVHAGTRDEASDEQGMAHFIEHMLFKGTSKRKAWHILNRMELVGGELNAYTTKEETFVYSVFLAQDFQRAVELMSDLIFHSIFPEKAIERERDVILDEINSYKDSPSELIYDEFENMVFAGHPIGKNILGTPESLQSFDADKCLSFMNRLYLPSNIVFFSSGSTPFDKVLRYAEKYMSDTSRGGVQLPRLSPVPVAPSMQVIHHDTYQTHVMIGSIAYNLYDNRRDSLFFLNNILGGPGMNNRLNVSLREKNGLVYDIESNVVNYTDTGLFTVNFGCDPKNEERCTSLMLQELKKLRENKLTHSQMEKARKQLTGQVAIAAENREGSILNVAKSYLHFNKYEEESELFKRINAITSEDLLVTAHEIFDESKFYRLVFR
ncbi:MAG: pitrilysin family protein [Bacteroidales bacterium]|jgi:predicted Zn-dependent peptidase|nr:pitrilysin family protein [Bacteroidales bacterium]MDD3160693.1 pitrilysin family protein [Bacteroidales bacterium]